ncbi:BfmA/BtgA family mobilization protein [Sinomicrobium soli]|uniref:BfmA/BtgA family mobilization protein n=1 Tax=Sinomicrobium sp. N-1-3-6 TaxID=2219864 RepID=UPI00191C0B9F|nr:BfmA/BtgA family mobilization protein [Sinomicrobium sp. N-1-3-6]
MKYEFATIRIKKKIADRFRVFSKKIAPNHSQAMASMLDFFEINKLSPNEILGPNMVTLEKKLKSRLHAVVAIIKDMEKHQTKPTVAMLQNLFEQADTARGKSKVPGKKKRQEKKNIPGSGDKTSPLTNLDLEEALEQVSLYKEKHNRAVQELSHTKKEITTFLDKVKPIRSNFGKPYLRIDLPVEALERLKRKLNLKQ